MNVDIMIMVVVTLLLAMLGVAILLGRADWAIKQYRRNSERYNLLRLRVVTGAVHTRDITNWQSALSLIALMLLPKIAGLLT